MGATVTVACKLPHGIVLRGFAPHTVTVPVLGGGMRETTEYRETGERFHVNGNAVPVMRDPKRDYPAIVGGPAGFALTHGVPAELWQAWLAANKDTPMVKNGLIYAHEKADNARDHAKANTTVRSGFEPLSPDGDPRMPRRLSRDVGRPA